MQQGSGGTLFQHTWRMLSMIGVWNKLVASGDGLGERVAHRRKIDQSLLHMRFISWRWTLGTHDEWRLSLAVKLCEELVVGKVHRCCSLP